jgi:uncharacterized protein (DUF362 family)
MDRRDFLLQTAAATTLLNAKPLANLGIPGPFPGRVIAVEKNGVLAAGNKYQRPVVNSMIEKGMTELTGAPSPQEAWRMFFEPSDVVGIKLNPVGRPHVISSPEVFLEIVDGLRSAGVPAKNIVAYDRYRREFLQAGFDKWLPDGVRWTFASEQYREEQLDMDGYDSSEFVEMPLVLPKANPADAHQRRSYLSRFISKDVNKMINLCVLKHHQSAGVTLALKNLSHGLVNNVNRSHPTTTLNTCGTFIPNIVDHRIIRQKVVLNVLDGVLGAYHGGPGGKVGKYTWAHETMYFATDPVALDKTGWRVIDAKRVASGMAPIVEAKPDADSTYTHMQVEHIEIASALGLGRYDDKEITVRRVTVA